MYWGASWEAQAESRDGVSLLISKLKRVHQAGKHRDEWWWLWGRSANEADGHNLDFSVITNRCLSFTVTVTELKRHDWTKPIMAFFTTLVTLFALPRLKAWHEHLVHLPLCLQDKLWLQLKSTCFSAELLIFGCKLTDCLCLAALPYEPIKFPKQAGWAGAQKLILNKPNLRLGWSGCHLILRTMTQQKIVTGLEWIMKT